MASADGRDRFMFNVQSANKKPGHGVMEFVREGSQYKGLASIKDWRKLLSNDYVFDFEMDGSIWPSIDHYVIANNYKHKSEIYNSLKKDGSGVLSKMKLKDQQEDVLEKALLKKFSMDPFKLVLLETKNAELTHWKRGMVVLTTSDTGTRYIEPNLTCKILMKIRHELSILPPKTEEVIVENKCSKQLELKILSKKEIDDFEGFITKYNKSTNKSVNVLTKYEKTNIIGVRMEQLSMGCETYIQQDLACQLQCVKKIAEEEFKQKKIPYIICRTMPNNVKEYWKLADLIYTE